jgi:hypothetical protein
MKMKFKIKGIELELAIQKIDEVDNASISFMTERMIIECDENNKDIVMEKIKKVIKKEEPDATIEEI